jgi:hypothetical protein
MNTSWDETDGNGLSGRLWSRFLRDGILICRDRSLGIGFFDDFLEFQASTLEGPYLLLEGTNCSIEQVADTGDSATTGLGLVKMILDGNAAADEVVLQRGRGLSAPFKLADKTLCFEARLKVDAITAAKWAWAVGLGEVGMGATDCLFVDTTSILADKNFLGFVKLQGEGAAVDGAYKADGQTYQDGATKTKLDSLATMVAGTFVKIGFRYSPHPKMIQWFVDGVEIVAARLLADEIDAATFPDDVFLAPIIGAKDHAGDAAFGMTIDWLACAQEA